LSECSDEPEGSAFVSADDDGILEAVIGMKGACAGAARETTLP
jgi:hypothetical protein